MPQLPNRLRLNLPDPFPRHPKLLPNLLQSPRPTVLQPETQLQHHALPVVIQRIQDILDLLPQQLRRSGVRRRQRGPGPQ